MKHPKKKIRRCALCSTKVLHKSDYDHVLCHKHSKTLEESDAIVLACVNEPDQDAPYITVVAKVFINLLTKGITIEHYSDRIFTTSCSFKEILKNL